MFTRLRRYISSYFIGDLVANCSDVHEKIKIYLLLNLPLGYTILSLFTLPIMILNEVYEVLYVAMGAIFLNISSVFILKFSGNIKGTALFFSIVNFMNNTIIFFLLGSKLDFGATPYFILQLIYVAFLLDKRWTLTFGIINFLTVGLLAILAQYGLHYDCKTIQEPDYTISIVGNFAIVLIMTYYLVMQFLLQRNIAASTLKKSNYRISRLNSILKEKNEEIHSQHEETLTQRDLIETRRQELELKNREITDSLNYAKRIQQAIFPPEATIERVFPKSFILYMPKDIVSGDFYFIDEYQHLKFAAVVDCTGHGVPGAFMSIVGYKALHRIIHEMKIHQANRIIEELNLIVNETIRSESSEISDGMDLALCVIDEKNKKIDFSGAMNGLIISTKNELKVYKGDRRSVGKAESKNIFTSQIISYDPGDILYLASDGYQDQFGGPKGKKLTSKRVIKVIKNNLDQPIKQQKISYKNFIYDWMKESEQPQLDDICVAGIQLM